MIRVLRAESAPGGWMVTLREEDAYRRNTKTDNDGGEPNRHAHFEVFLPYEALAPGKTKPQRKAAIEEAIEHNPIEGISRLKTGLRRRRR